jgi:HemK-like putative methylase
LPGEGGSVSGVASLSSALGEVTFNGLKLATWPGRVMTPRATSEQLVAAARAQVGNGGVRVADVGTGGGAIAIAIALACPHAEVWATDTSADAVALARANVRRHRLRNRVRIRQGDLLAPVPGRFDVIAAHLPYLPPSVAASRPELASEPYDAIFAGGDGLEPYRRLVDAAASRLTRSGLLLLQLDRRLVAAERGRLPALRAALAATWPASVRAEAVIKAIAGKAA